MFRNAAIVPLLALAACTPEDPFAGGTANGGSLRVTLVEDYYWPAPVTTAEGVEIEVFPLVTALVVESRDGRPLDAADEEASREAARAHCSASGQSHPAGANARLSDGAWAFSPCLARAG